MCFGSFNHIYTKCAEWNLWTLEFIDNISWCQSLIRMYYWKCRPIKSSVQTKLSRKCLWAVAKVWRCLCRVRLHKNYLSTLITITTIRIVMVDKNEELHIKQSLKHQVNKRKCISYEIYNSSPEAVSNSNWWIIHVKIIFININFIIPTDRDYDNKYDTVQKQENWAQREREKLIVLFEASQGNCLGGSARRVSERAAGGGGPCKLWL